MNVAFAGRDSGEPLLLLHGFPESWWSWRHQFEALTAEGFRVIAPDLRGAGKSDIRGPYELAELADDIAALLDVLLGGSPTPVIGHDWGGATAWTLARRHARLPSRLAIINSCLPERQIEAISTHFDAQQFSRSWYVILFQVPWLADWLLSKNDGALVKDIIRRGMKDPSSISEAELEPFCLPAVRPGGAGGMLGPYRGAFWRALADLLRTGDPFPEREHIDCPTLLVWGDGDPAQGFSLVTGMQAVVPDLRIVRFPRCGHFPHSETPPAVNDALLAFLAER